MPIRNPFRRAGVPEAIDETQRSAPENGFKSTAVSGVTPLQTKDPAEYKLSGEISSSVPGAQTCSEATSAHRMNGRLPCDRNKR
jgi:hypothetical protein